jgi:hypothetical protein
MLHTYMPKFFLLLSVVIAGGLLVSSCSREAAETPQVFDLGHRVSLGHLTYTAFETAWHTQLGSAATARVPQNRFLVVRMSIMNGGGEQLEVPNMTVEDDKGKSYEELSNGDGVTNWMGYLRRAKPAESVDGMIVFDAPPQHYHLKITDENGNHSAYIDLPLSFGSEIPEMPAPTPIPVSPPGGSGKK